MVSNTSDDLPEPETPVTTVSRLCGIARDTSLRLWTRAPRMKMDSSKGMLRAGLCGRYFDYLAMKDASVERAGLYHMVGDIVSERPLWTPHEDRVRTSRL